MKRISRQLLLLLSEGLQFRGEYFPYERIYQFFPVHYQGSLRVVLARLVKQGYVEKIVKNGEVCFRLSLPGIKHLTRRFQLAPDQKRIWDGVWRIIIVPQTLYRKGDVGEKLNDLGFRTIQKSVYVSPYPCGDAFIRSKVWYFEKVVLPLSVARRVASFVWSLDTVYGLYSAWIKKAREYRNIKSVGGDLFGSLIGQYEAIVRQDPLLPKEVLLPHWPKAYAQKLFVRLVKERFVGS